jgi:hypothetical protein
MAVGRRRRKRISRTSLKTSAKLRGEDLWREAAKMLETICNHASRPGRMRAGGGVCGHDQGAGLDTPKMGRCGCCGNWKRMGG